MIRVVSHAGNRIFEPFRIETTRPTVPRERYRSAVTRRNHTRQMLDSLQHLLVIVVALLWLSVFLAWQDGAHRQNFFRLDHRILPEKLKQRLNEKTCAHEQHERERHFKHDHRATQAPGRSYASTTLFQRVVQVEVCRLKRGHETEDNSSDD